MSDSTERKPFFGLCGACGHCWPVFYAPMAMGLAAELGRAARCPMCASADVLVADQADGKLIPPPTAETK